MNQQISASNRKAYHEYHILDKYEAGIELFGTEVKSLREAQANLKESYVIVRKNQAWISGMHINRYSNTGHEGHDPTRNRRLLLNKREILKIKQSIEQKGLTVVPLKLYFSQNGWAKVEIGLAKGKKIFDKKSSIKERDIKRDMQRELRDKYK
jgi:SsrA-binding protein